MGLFDKLKPKSPLEKAAKQVKEVYAQPDYRRAAMDKLFEIATPEAYTALLGRFTINANGQIADESEKRELVDQLVSLGEPVVEPLKQFIRSEKTIAFPIRALQKILGRQDSFDFLLETLLAYEPLDHRTTQAKTTLIFSIAEVAAPEDADKLASYLGDHADDVQFQTIEALQKLENPDSTEALAKVCTSDEHSGRVQRRAAQALVDLGWNVKPYFGDFPQELKDEYMLGKKGVLVKKSTTEE
ncbi:MAG: HEAT repeat domain-containing protein [Deltaproteobacteria bacterium]